MIAKNYIKYPEALRFQVEMFSNGYHNSPRIMRLMEVIFNFQPEVPAWVKEAAARAKALVKRWKAAQVLLNFTDRYAIITDIKRRRSDVAYGQRFGQRLGVSSVYVGPYGETWTGRGFRPAWVRNLVELGGNIADWLIQC